MRGQNIKYYRDLLIWKKGIGLVKEIYLLTKKFPKSERFALTDQIHRAAISIPSNIAEGHTRHHSKEFRQFLYVALGSLAELDTQLTIAMELEYVSDNDLNVIYGEMVELRKMINGILSKLTPDPSSLTPAL